MIRNLHYYGRNEGIAYPIAEDASCVSDAGVYLPPNIIADLNLRWPNSLGTRAFVSAVSVTPYAVSVTIEGDNGSTFTPLAVVTVKRPVTIGRAYTLKAQTAGVAGWIVFGSGTEDIQSYLGRFSTPEQSFLVPRAARAYAPLPVTSMAVNEAGIPLTGLVTLKTAAPLTALKEEREVDGVLRDCIVLRLAADGGDGYPTTTIDALAGLRTPPTWQAFAGPCGGRPESRTCGDPQPVEFIDAVGPDCDGVITVVFSGCAHVSPAASGCGVVIDCGFGLSEACTRDRRLPDSDGKLPHEYNAGDTGPYENESSSISSLSESYGVDDGLPYTNCFTLGDVPPDFYVKNGLWSWVNDDPPGDSPCVGESVSTSDGFITTGSYSAASAASRNVSVWRDSTYTTGRRSVSTALKLVTGPTGAKHNAGIVLNYQVDQNNSRKHTYYLVEIDYDGQFVRLAKFNGVSTQTIVSADTPGIKLDTWYTLTAEVRPGAITESSTLILVSLSSDDGASILYFAVPTNDYLPAEGQFGLHANRAISRFGYFSVSILL